MYCHGVLLSHYRMIITGWRRALQNSDLWSLNPRDRSETVAPKLANSWQQELDKTRYNTIQQNMTCNVL